MRRLLRTLFRAVAPARLPSAQRVGQRSHRSGWQAPFDDVFLRRLERLSVISRQHAAGGLGGEHRSKASANSTDFVDFRHYQAGDDFRRIDWNAYGRLDQLYVKLTEARERLSVHLLLDCSASMAWGEPHKFDYARQLSAGLAYVALCRYDRVVVHALWGKNVSSRPFRGLRAFGSVLSFLDQLTTDGISSFGSRLSALRLTGRGKLLLLSDLLDPAGPEVCLEALARLSSDAAVIQVLAPDELAPQGGGDVELWDLETDESVNVGLSPEVLGEFRRRIAEWCAGCEQACTARGFDYVRALTSSPLADVLLVSHRRRAVLQ